MEPLNVRFNVRCGDWIFPSRTSSTGVNYPIRKPLVAEIFKPDAGRRVSDSRKIDSHLNGPQFLKLILLEGNSLFIESLGNEQDETFCKDLGFEIYYKPKKLARPNDLWPGGEYFKGLLRNPEVRSTRWNAIFFTSVLLQAYLDDFPLPDDIVFRKAKMPEIESLGRWRR